MATPTPANTIPHFRELSGFIRRVPRSYIALMSSPLRPFSIIVILSLWRVRAVRPQMAPIVRKKMMGIITSSPSMASPVVCADYTVDIFVSLDYNLSPRVSPLTNETKHLFL